MNKTLIAGIVSIVAVVITGLFFMPQVNVNVESPKIDIPDFGAISGPTIYSDDMNFNGVQHWYYSKALYGTATTTICSIKTPGATTTPAFLSLSITTSTSTAYIIDVGKSTNPTATTTLLIPVTSMGANEKLELLVVSTTTISTANSLLLFAPNNYIVFKIQSGKADNTNYSGIKGTCKAILRELN